MLESDLKVEGVERENRKKDKTRKYIAVSKRKSPKQRFLFHKRFSQSSQSGSQLFSLEVGLF